MNKMVHIHFRKAGQLQQKILNGNAIKFTSSTNNEIGWLESDKQVYYNKTKVCDNVTDFIIEYKKEDNSITVKMKIDNESFEQTYTFR